MSQYLITGANRGIGLAFTKQLLNRGDSVIACCRNPENATELNELSLKIKNDSLIIYKLDVNDETAIKSLPKFLIEKGLLIDVLILNAGIAEPSETIGSLYQQAILQTINTNAIAPMLTIQALSNSFKTQNRYAKIICISSDLGSITYASDLTYGLSYGMSKAALNMGVKKISTALSQKKIAIIALHPGWVLTDLGGANATFSPIQSVEFMLTVIDNLTIAQTGSFLDFRGQKIPW
jgi:NAD(P)-dependent dehydrogenase (short-subunit alcohol dehydrogenase family)